MNTLANIAAFYAKKQDLLVDALTEESPILKSCRWTAASHKMWNVAEVLTDVKGAGFVNMNAPLPAGGVSTGTKKVDLSVMGAQIEVPRDTADMYGGAATYFAKHEKHILAQAGNATEKTLYYDNWLRYALDNKNFINAGGTGTGTSSIVAITFNEASNVGLYDPTCFDQGTLLQTTALNNGSLYTLNQAPYAGTNGYGVELRGRFGWQLLDPRYVAAIVNIQENHYPSAEQIDTLLSMCRATTGKTYIYCAEMTKVMSINPHKKDRVIQMNDKNIDTGVEAWGAVPIITSYNIGYKNEVAVS